MIMTIGVMSVVLEIQTKQCLFYIKMMYGMKKISTFLSIILIALGLCRCSLFEMPEHEPMVATLDVTNISTNSATLNGKIEYPGNPVYTEKGFVYSATNLNPMMSVQKIVVSGINADFSAHLAELSASTTFHVWAYIMNKSDTVYGERVDFTTKIGTTTESDYWVLNSANLMVQKNDLSSGNTWNMAKKLCESSTLGGYTDWRLPTIDELREIYNNQNVIGKLSGGYWSSSSYSSSSYYYYYIDMNTGSDDYTNKNSIFKVRAVRSIGN